MERLTERFMHGLGVKYCYDSCSVCDVAGCCGLLEEMLEKLAHYEDLEEQGGLIELPYAVGDMVYVIAPRYVECDKKYNCEDYNSEEYLITWCQNYCPNGYKGKGISPTKIEAIHIIEDGIDLSTTLGRYHIENVFTTREEAEAKLKEMEGAE